jgi:hypothetical protein
LVLAPLVAGTRRTRAAPELEPLTLEPRGVPSWRMVTLGVGVDNRALPMRLGLSIFGAELSTRSIDKLGHTAFMLPFDFPLRAPPSLPR